MTEQAGRTVANCSGDEMDMLDLLLTLASHWRLIAGITLISAIISSIVVIMIPNRYQATAKVLPLQRQTIVPLNAAFTGTGAVPVAGAQFTNFVQTTLPILPEILQSEPVFHQLTQQYAFQSSAVLKSVYRVKTAKSGAIEVTVEDTDPRRAADVANAAVTELGRRAYALNLVDSPSISFIRDEKININTSIIIKLLEPATTPTQKVKPKHSRIILLSTISAAFASVLLVFILEGLQKMKANDYSRLGKMTASIKTKPSEKSQQANQ